MKTKANAIAVTVAASLVALPAHAQGPTAARARPSVAPKAMQEIAPGLADYTDDVLFGDVWVRPQLAPRDRSLVTLSVLVATGKAAQLQSHLRRGLDNGLKPTEVAGLVTQLAFYSGWPNAVSALTEIEKVFTERRVVAAVLRLPMGPTHDTAAFDPAAARESEAIAPAAPKLAQITDQLIYGDLWHRTDLTARDRSLVTIAALAASGDEAQLAIHIRRGIQNGLTRQQIGEALTHLAFYAGLPKATAAAVVLGRSLSTEEAVTEAGAPLVIVRPGARPSAAPASNFTGSATVTSPFKGTGGARLGGGTVSFAPGAHTNWHTHPLGQLLVVTAGSGWVQAQGGPVRTMRVGDVVWTAPGVKHWHGATRDSALTHVAVAEALDGATVTWMEPVSDAQYRGPD